MNELEECYRTVLDMLVRAAQGLPYDEDVLEESGTMLAAAEMINMGMDFDVVCDKFETEEYELRFKLDSDGDLSVTVDWTDVESGLELTIDRGEL